MVVSTKGKIIHTVELMDEDSAILVLNWLNDHFMVTYKKPTWDDIEEVDPDEIDLEMMKEIESDSECNEFISKESLLSRRMANKEVKSNDSIRVGN